MTAAAAQPAAKNTGPPKHKRSWSEGHLFSGMSLRPWVGLLLRNRLAISPGRAPAAAVNTGMAALNSALGLVQRAVHGRGISQTEVPDDPVFILGHWRSGTTLAHELLALDPRNRCPTTYECLSPHHFLISEAGVRRWLRFLMPRKRPWDNMKLGFDHPQEDETALCALGARSPFLTVAFPNRPLQDPGHVDLLSLSPAEFDRWQRILKRFYQSILYRRPGRLVLKSPQHTFRVKTLARLFPRAQFIHIVRNPYVVYSSTMHFWNTTFEAYAFQSPPYKNVEENVFETFARMEDSLESALQELSENRYTRLRYEDLVADPVQQMAEIYERLHLGDFEPARAGIEHYANRTRKYQTNQYDLTPEQTGEISRRWKPYIEKYGYAVRT